MKTISSRHIAKALVSLAEKHPQEIERTIENFFHFMEKRSILSQLPAIIRELKIQITLKKKERTLSVHLPMAPLPGDIEKIARYIGAPHSALKELVIDEGLLGGFLAYWKDVKVNATISHAIDKFRVSIATT